MTSHFSLLSSFFYPRTLFFFYSHPARTLFVPAWVRICVFRHQLSRDEAPTHLYIVPVIYMCVPSPRWWPNVLVELVGPSPQHFVPPFTIPLTRGMVMSHIKERECHFQK